MADPGGKGCEIVERMVQRHQSVRGDRSRKGGGTAAMVLPGTQKQSPLPGPCNLNHPTKSGRKPRAGREVPTSAKGRRVGAAQFPARAHREPALASSQCENTLKRMQKSRQKGGQSRSQ